MVGALNHFTIQLSLPLQNPSNAKASYTIGSGHFLQLTSTPGPVLSDLWLAGLGLHLLPYPSHLFQVKPLS